LQNTSIETRVAFTRADEECCYNCNYCPYVVLKRYISDRAKYARNQYPLTTTYKSDYRAFKPSLPDNDIKIMALIRNWGIGPDFLHHPHLDTMSSPQPETLYQQTNKRFDCCAGGKKNILQQLPGGGRNLCAGDSYHSQQQPNCSIRGPHEAYRHKFTLLGNNPQPHHQPNHNPHRHCKPTFPQQQENNNSSSSGYPQPIGDYYF